MGTSIWKPLRSPVEDWPLALCDPRTMDHASETIGVDTVTRQGVSENSQVYFSPQHRFYYVEGQLSSEAALFCQVDTAKGEQAGKYIVCCPFDLSKANTPQVLHTQVFNTQMPRKAQLSGRALK
jgi:hypothetical protein